MLHCISSLSFFIYYSVSFEPSFSFSFDDSTFLSLTRSLAIQRDVTPLHTERSTENISWVKWAFFQRNTRKREGKNSLFSVEKDVRLDIRFLFFFSSFSCSVHFVWILTVVFFPLFLIPKKKRNPTLISSLLLSSLFKWWCVQDALPSHQWINHSLTHWM